MIDSLTGRGARIHLDTTVESAVDGVVQLSTGETFESDVIIWTAGVKPSPLLLDTDLPVDARGRLTKVVHSGSVNNGVTTTYTYDRANNRVTKTTS